MTKKATKRTGKKSQPKKPATTTPAAPSKPLGALSAASQVLRAAKAPMTCQELIEAMASKKLWVSPSGKTPGNTLHAALMKEITTKGAESRFAKAERGKFASA